MSKVSIVLGLSNKPKLSYPRPVWGKIKQGNILYVCRMAKRTKKHTLVTVLGQFYWDLNVYLNIVSSS